MDAIVSDYSGRTVGHWRLLRLLGQGAFGAVYEAQHGSISGRHAALKVLHPHMSLDADIKRRFINEASAASRAEHENIVQVFDGGVTEDEIWYLVMELLRGTSLRGLLQQGRVDVPRALNIGVQMAGALRAAHALSIVHRDLKPDNIFIVARTQNAEFVKVLDFGIAKLQDELGDSPATRSGMWLGTPAYMSPEQWRTLPDIDGRADIYACGVILYECLTGQLPFHATNPFGWLNAHLNDPVPDAAALAPVPPELGGLIRRMLAKAREDRPQSMDEVLDHLEPLREQHPMPEPKVRRSAGMPQAAAAAQGSSPSQPLSPGRPSVPSTVPVAASEPRFRVWPVAIWGTVLAVAGVGAWLGMSIVDRRPKAPDGPPLPAVAPLPKAAAPAQLPGGPLFSYQARLSSRDHLNSKGGPIHSAAEVIRQDRANFHRFGQRDEEDGGDPMFADKDQRDHLEHLLRDHIAPDVAHQIVSGTPRVKVQVWGDRAEVSILQE